MVKKAQMKVQQTIFMLLALTLFFVLAGIFLLVFGLSGIRNTATELQERNALMLVTKLANSPEFSCGESFGSGKINCIDADKVMMLRESRKRYEDFWGVLNIEIRKVYPETNKEILCSVNNYPNCNVIRIISDELQGAGTSNFISLCRKESDEGRSYDKCEIAKMIISYEIK